MPGPVPLVEVRRGGQVESVHFGHAAVCDVQGRVVLQWGEGGQPTFLRSAAKPFQALPVLRGGAAERFGLTDAEVALCCSSHGGQPIHLQTARGILSKIGASENDYQCGPHLPYHPGAAEELLRAGARPTKIHNNCSGKHAGMLAACKHHGWPVATYHQADHPLQIAILEAQLAFAAGARVGPVAKPPLAIDGCGVPTYYLPLIQAATAYARLANPEQAPADYQTHAERITRAMTAHPILVAEEGQFNTLLLEHLGRHVVGKSGAEGVFCAGLRGRGLGLAVKISDGQARAVAPVVLRLLEQLLHEVSVRPLAAAVLKPLTNSRGEEVGELRCVA